MARTAGWMPRAISRSSSSAPVAPAAARSSSASELAELGRHRGLRRAQLQRQRDQPLLGAVVQVPLDPPARLVGGGDDPRPRGGHLGLCPGVRDRGRDQLGEPGQPRLGVRRQRAPGG